MFSTLRDNAVLTTSLSVLVINFNNPWLYDYVLGVVLTLFFPIYIKAFKDEDLQENGLFIIRVRETKTEIKQEWEHKSSYI